VSFAKKGDWISIGTSDLFYDAPEVAIGGVPHGYFTWYWAKSLGNLRPGDTWRDVFNRTQAYLYNDGRKKPKFPVIMGLYDRLVVEGDKANELSSFAVLNTFKDGDIDSVVINSGLFAGIEIGTEFYLGDPSQEAYARMQVYYVEPTKCKAHVTQGKVELGDKLRLTSWLPPRFKVRVFYKAERKKDEELLGLAKDAFSSLDFVEEVKEQMSADMVALIIRPPIAASDDVNLVTVEANAQADPQLWLLDPLELSFFWDQELLRSPLDEESLASLVENFQKASKAKAMLDLATPPGELPLVLVTYKLFAPTTREEFDRLPESLRFEKENDKKTYKLISTADSSEIDVSLGKDATIVVLDVENQDSVSYFVYGINITNNGAITTFLPSKRHQTINQVAQGQKKYFEKDALIFTEPQEYVRLFILPKSDINIDDLNQTPLEDLSASSAKLDVTAFLKERKEQGTGTTRGGGLWSTTLTRFSRDN
jgi:hypothetical protein